MTSLNDRRYAMARCLKCHSCRQSPELESHAHSSICPSQDFGVFYAYTAAGKQAAAYALSEGRIGHSEALSRNVYACSMCGACQTACTWNHEGVDPLDTLYVLRERLAKDGQSPPEHTAMLDSLRLNGNPFGKPRLGRMAWAKDLGIKNAAAGVTKVLLHIGATLAYRTPEEARAVVRLLQAARVDFAIMLDDEPEFGGLAFDLGYPQIAHELSRNALNRLAAIKPQKIVVCGADTIATIRGIHPRIGLTAPPAETLHITEFLAQLAKAGTLKFSAKSGKRLAYHDPCKLGRLSDPNVAWQGRIRTDPNTLVDFTDPPKSLPTGTGGIYDAPRELLVFAGFELVEFERRRELSYCCGAAGGANEVYPEFGDKAARSRHSEATSIGAAAIATACGACLSHLAKGGASIPTEGLYSLLAASLDNRKD